MIIGVSKHGLRYAVKQAGNLVGYCSLHTRCGTRNEEGFTSGIAHFTEHTIFKGTKYKTARVISNYLDKLGGELNAYTTKEEIVLHATVLKEDLKKAEALLIELATSATFPQKEVDIEKGVVLEEIRSYKDNPSEDIYDKFEDKLFFGHPLSFPILGSVKGINKITSKELQNFVKQHFTPDNMVITVVCNKDEKLMEKELLSIIDKFFESCPIKDAKTGYINNNIYFNPYSTVFNIEIAKKNHEANAILGSFAPSLYMEKEKIACILLCNILGGPASNSLLNNVLREKNGWVYNVESSYTQYSDSGIFTISMGCEKGKLYSCINAIKKEIIKLQTCKLSETKLHAVKKQLHGQIAIASDNIESQCLGMGKSLISFGDIATDESIYKKIEAISAFDLMDSANNILALDKLSSLIYL